jgi:uncharacterized membrane protein YccF (DUF307 family)
VGNIIWILLEGWWLALLHVLAALLFFITIIGIPFGVANLKLARLALLPFGMEVANEPAVSSQTVLVIDQLGSAPQGSVTGPS